jgi:hypothetical protein
MCIKEWGEKMNRISKVLLLAAAAAIVLSLSTCAFDIPAGALSYISQAQLNKLVSMGMKINQGQNPPTVNGDYYCNSLTRTGGNIPNDSATTFANLGLRFTSQGSDNQLLVSYDQSGYESGTGLGAYISGAGNDFSVFAQISGISGGINFKDAMVFSGTITPSGIKDFKYALILTDKDPDPSGYLIEVDQGRVIAEDDAFAATAVSYPTGTIEKGQRQLSAGNSR